MERQKGAGGEVGGSGGEGAEGGSVGEQVGGGSGIHEHTAEGGEGGGEGAAGEVLPSCSVLASLCRSRRELSNEVLYAG